MTANYESDRHDRRYEVDARGVAEFGQDRILRRFIPWGAVQGIELSHDRRRTQVRWSVTSADGSRIKPKLEYTNSLDCYNDAIRAWRACVPHACREHFRRVYGKARRALALVHLFWLIPALCVYGMFGLAYALHADVDWQDVGPLSALIAIMYVCCVVHVGGVTSCSRFTDAGIEIQRAFAFRRSFYEYNRVRFIEHRGTFPAPNGNTVKRPHFVISFDDGTSWSSRDGLRDPVPEFDEKIAQLVSERSKRPIIKQP